MSINSNSNPGASALRESQRRRVARETQVLNSHPRIGKALLFVSGTPPDEQRWQRGAEGEQLSGVRLERLLRNSGVELLHDRRIPNSRANIDHIAIGPGGVTVIDTKRLRGTLRIHRKGGVFTKRREWLSVNGRNRNKLIDGVHWQMRVVDELLGGVVEMDGALCFIDPHGLPLFGRPRVNNVMLTGPRGVARLARRPGRLSRAQVLDITDWLDSRLRRA